jgi:hypothetical protein
MLLTETLDAAADALGGLPERTSVHLDRGYDSKATRERLEERLEKRGLLAEISQKGKPAPLAATKRWMVERNQLLAQRPQEADVVHGAPGAGYRLLGGLLRRGHRHAETHPRSLESLSLGGSAFSPTVTYWRKL